MNKDENNIEVKEEYYIIYSFIKSAINNIFKNKSKNIQNNSNNKIIIQDISILLNSIKNMENMTKFISKHNSKQYNLLKRNINYINKISLNKQNKKNKQIKIEKYEIILSLFIIYLKNAINEKKHQKIKRLLLTIIRFTTENIFPTNFFSILTEIFINILIIIINNNQDFKYSLNDEPFLFINDIIESLITYPKEIKIEDTNNYILTDVIDIFDKYLITPNYVNINFRETYIYLKFLENNMINPLKENEIINNNNNVNDEENKDNNVDVNNKDNYEEKDKDNGNVKENIQKKIYYFLIKIYKFSMKDEYFQNSIMKKGIINLKYSINILNYLIHLYDEEEKLQIDSSFKIINGFSLQKDNFLFLPNLKLKLTEFSIIFSFKINQIQKDFDNISILNIYTKPKKPILHLFLDKNNYLTILYNGDKKWNTYIKIQENKYYLICLSESKLFIGNKLSLFINESITDENILKDEKLKGFEIQDSDSCYYYKNKKVNLELSKEFFLELGKNNFIGIIGEFLIINKNFDKNNIHHLFNLKENYSSVLSKMYNKYQNLNYFDSVNWKKIKYGINMNKLNSGEKASINFFKEFGYEIKLEIMTYKIHRFTKLKYFSQNYYNQELSNNSIKTIKEKEKEYCEQNISLISMLSSKSNNNSLNSSSVYSVNYNSESNSNLFNTNNTTLTFQKDLYKQEKVDISLNIYKLRYSSVVFYQSKGMDFLTLQLHNIISTIEDQKLLGIYLYEIIYFVYKLMLLMTEDIIDSSIRQCPKLDNKISIFFLTLLTLLNKKKENIILNNNVILKLLEILDYFRFNQLFAQRNMILSILLEVQYYENKSDIMKYPKLFKTITSDLVDDSNNDITIMSNEILYKILMLDFIFELKEYKHKLLMKLISAFISFDKYKTNTKSGDGRCEDDNMINEFINYFLGLKNEIKIYHYLKIIYLNLNKIKNKLLNNEKFLENTNMRMEKINSNHCKYCAYNQILWYLIFEEIYIKSSSGSDYCFHYNPIGFMKNPTFYFIKCIFIQCFDISYENKLKYIKNKSNDMQFILSIIKNNIKKDISSNIDNKLLEIIGYKKFVPRFKAISEYLKFLYDEQKESKDIQLLNIIKDSVNIIMNFLKEICNLRKKNLKDSNYIDYRKNWSIVNDNNGNLNTYLKESEKRNKQYKMMKKIEEFINELLCSKGMKIFYILYMNINYKKAIEDINDFVVISAKNVYNPFYFYFFSPNLDFYNNINKEYLLEKDDENDNSINNYIKSQLFYVLETELNKCKLIFDESKEYIIVQNNILLLIYIYQNIVKDKIIINEEFEKYMVLFLAYLLDNYFINSKYIFDINTILEADLKKIPNKKFLLEIIADIYFIFYDNQNYDFKYQYLIKNLFTNSKSNLKAIDEQYFTEQKSKGLCYKFFNHSSLSDICKGMEVSEILYIIYFLYYLCEKLNMYENNFENKDTNEPIKLIKEIMSELFINAVKLFHELDGINLQKNIPDKKNVINKYPYKIYKNFIMYFNNNKEKTLTLEKFIAYYEKLIAKKEINMERNTYFLNDDILFRNYGLDSTSNKNSISFMHSTHTWKQTNIRNIIQKHSLGKIDENPRENKSRYKEKLITNFNKVRILEKIFLRKRSKSFEPTKITSKSILTTDYLKTKSSKNIEKISRKVTIEESENDYNSDKNNNSLNNSINFNDDKKKNSNNQLIKDKDNVINNNNIIKNEENIKGNENNNIIDEKIEIPVQKNFSIKDDISDISEEENIVQEYDITKKLKSLNIPSKFYRNIFHLSDPNTLKILFNPKEYYIWNKFCVILKDIIFHHKKFNLLSKIFRIKYKDIKDMPTNPFYKTKTNKYILNYPSKLKNFLTEDYYRPFLKPDINFFKHKLLPKSHSYLNIYKNIFINNYTDEDNLCKIKFERILPINYDLRPTKKIVCELINNNGSIYGNIYFNHAFLLFISDNNNDPRKEKNNKNVNEDLEEFYLYSYFLEERLKTKKKFIIMYFCEIKEIFIRRFCLNYLGYEIFMKDNRSHLFNFFNKTNLKNFLQIMSEKLELSYKKQNTNNIPIYSHNENILSLQILNYNINSDINFMVINDPLYAFEKNGYKSKYQKGEITNFKYLLLLNKYSSRTYKDNSQYLIFPLLYMDLEKRIKRDLSKPISLNKKQTNEAYFIDNFKNFGNHFNSHYSTAGYILYYLVRLNPFTFSHIKLQSGKFDAPERMFSNLTNYLSAINTSEENRELCPELFCFYEAFINLNHNYLGVIKSDKILINDFYCNDQNGIIEYIITNRQSLEKINIVPWIDNIFGYNQLPENEDIINVFPLSSYEQKNNFEEERKKLEKEGKSRKQIIEKIKNEICVLSLGISPVQIFKTNHPLRNATSKRLYSFFDGGMNTSINQDKIVKSLAHKNLNNFINSNMNNKYQIFCIPNENNSYGMKLLIKSKKIIHILKMYNNETSVKNNPIIKLELWKKKQVKIDPISKICCELSPGIFCFCRYIDNVLHIKSEKQSFLYQYKCIITSLEFFSHSETKNTSTNNLIHINEILFGDEFGNLNLLQIEYEISNKKQIISIGSDKIKIIKEIKAHNSFIQGILYLKRLNIILSYSEEGQITINNAFSLNIMNIIELGEKYTIKNIKISDYDLMYIHCYNNINKKEYIKCYTLNGIKGTNLKTDGKINNYFVNEELVVVYENNLIELFNLYDLSSKPIYVINPDTKISEKDDKKDSQIEGENNIVFCDLIIKDMKMIIIYQDHNIIIQDIFT